MINRLIRDSGNIDVHCVRAEGDRPTAARPPLAGLTTSGLQQYLSACSVIAAVTGCNLLLSHWTGYYVVALVYLLAVTVLGLLVGRGPNLLAAALSALLWNFLFVPPLRTFRIGSLQDGLMFGALFVVALAMGQLMTRLRAQQTAEREREERAAALYQLTRELAEGKDFAE
jgi:two-component system sensor histidine kinase KdpD